MLGSMKTCSNIADEMKGVWLLVPKKRSTRGKTIVSPNSWSENIERSSHSYEGKHALENLTILSVVLTEIIANIGSNILMIFNTFQIS